MATGSGKTIVMAMLIAWQVLNKVTYPQQNKTKLAFLAEWVKAVNAHGGFGRWAWAVSYDPSDITDKLNLDLT